jgi:serine/threonine-protein kinase
LTFRAAESMIVRTMSEVAQRAGAPQAPVGAGAVLGGRFRLEDLLGSGGMAEVWRATDLSSQRAIAVKVLRAQVAASPEAVQRLKREGEVLSALSHPAIVRVEAYGQLEGGIVFLAMELLEGETLGARMRRGRMDPLELAPVVAGTCSALAAAHAKGIVHRDLKPDNVFLLPVPGGVDPRVKLLDFGISKIYGGEKLTYTGEVLGTPRYMSPEQLGTEPDVDPRVDVYALGVILYEALATKPPFLASNATDLIVAILHGKIVPLRSLRPELPAQLESVVMRAMARAREARYRTATELADAFLDAAGATARARALPVKPKAMLTQALGGTGGSSRPPPAMAMEVPAIPAPPATGVPTIEAGDPMRPGTFSAFGAVEESAVREARALPYATTAPSLPSIDPPAPAPVAQVPAAPPAQIAAPVPRAIAPAPTAQMMAAPPEEARTSTGARIALVAVGLVLGALSAAGAMAGLHFFGRGEAPPPPPVVATAPQPAAQTTEPPPPPTETGAAAATPATPETPDEPSPDTSPPSDVEGEGGEVPEGVEPPPEERRRRSGGSRRHREQQRSPLGPIIELITPDEPDHGHAPPPADPMEQAQRALSEGHPERCVEILDGVISRGGTPFALRRRADCLLRAGRRADAIRDYQRFCRIAPDHPAVPGVRETLAGMGLTCP